MENNQIIFLQCLLHCIPDSQNVKLQHNYSECCRQTCYTPSHIQILRTLHPVPVNRCIIFKILLLTNKWIHGSAPAFFRKLFQVYQPAQPSSLHSSSTLLLITLVTHSKTYRHWSFMNSHFGHKTLTGVNTSTNLGVKRSSTVRW